MEQARKSCKWQPTWPLSASPASSIPCCCLCVGLCQVSPLWHSEPIKGSREQG